MNRPVSQDIKSLGGDLRALRRARGMTLSEMASALGRSVGWLSQVERNISEPSSSDLRQMASVLGISLPLLLEPQGPPRDEAGLIVRRRARRPIGPRKEGLIEELLSPDLTDDFEVVHSIFQPGAGLTEPEQRDTQEVGYILSGRLDIEIGGKTFTLGPGDSFRIRGEPFRWINPYKEAAMAIWVISPPVY